MQGEEDRVTETAPSRRRAKLGMPPPHAAAPDRDEFDEREPEHDAMADRGLDEHGSRDEGGDANDLTDDEREALFIESIQQSILPDIPKIPGYHICWLTTSNLRDSLPWRERLGYVPVRVNEVRGWTGGNLKTGEDELVRINEMIAYKIPLRLYNRYMRQIHDVMPLAEEEKLRQRADQMKKRAEQMGARVDEGDGTANVVQRARPMPEFLE